MRSYIWYTGFLSALIATQAQADSNLSLGVEGFHDHYQEESLTVNVSSVYGSVTGSYEYTGGGFLVAVDGRYSQGREDYDSLSGKLDGEHAFETDDRLRLGLDIPTAAWHGHLMPYIGVGWRYYFDEGKGLRTDIGDYAYDRHISQFYLPVGTTYRFTTGDWTFSPNAEADALLYGQVNSHLSNNNPFLVSGQQEPNITNQQHTGWGLRGEFMAGQQYKDFGWEAGPFVRYWHIADSDCKATTNSPCLEEPANARLQAGMAARVNF